MRIIYYRQTIGCRNSFCLSSDERLKHKEEYEISKNNRRVIKKELKAEYEEKVYKLYQEEV